MTELQLYRFITENNIEWGWNGDKTEVYLLLPVCFFENFHEMLNKSFFEDGVEMQVFTDSVDVQMSEICDHHGVNMKNVFYKDNWDA